MTATHFSPDVPYTHWMQHACGLNDISLLNHAVQENDGRYPLITTVGPVLSLQPGPSGAASMLSASSWI